MQARVTVAFNGRPDTEILSREIREGEIISGDLASVAIGEGWAVAHDPEREAALAAAEAKVRAAKATLAKSEKTAEKAKEEDKDKAADAVAVAKQALADAEAEQSALIG